MEIRPLTSDDATAYWHVRLEALEGSPRAFSASPEDHRLQGTEGAAKRIASVEGERFVLGAWIEDALVGTVGFLRNESAKSRHVGLVWGVYVAPSARGLGVGSALLRALIEQAQGFGGLERLVLDVDSESPTAIRLYEGVGFRSFGLEPNALKVGNEYVHLHHMAFVLFPLEPSKQDSSRVDRGSPRL